MSSDRETLKQDIQAELVNLERLVVEMEQVRSRIAAEPTFVETRAAASILHDFYCGVEKIFKRVAVSVDEGLPKGEDCHTRLLSQMARPIEGVRKELIGDELFFELKGYLRFRHLFRNMYGFQLKWEQFSGLTVSLRDLLRKILSSLEQFFESPS